MTNEILAKVMDLISIIIGSVLASAGFWMFLLKKTDSRDLTRKLLVGLAHDRITYLSMKYIERGCITQDEYENIYTFLYEPYRDLGGNGSAKRMLDEVSKIPIVRTIDCPPIKQ